LGKEVPNISLNGLTLYLIWTIDNMRVRRYYVYTRYRQEAWMEKQLLIRIDNNLKERLERLARSEGKTTSEMVRELISEYVKEKDIGAYIEELWNKVSNKLREKGVRPDDVRRAVAETRKEHG
jgi:predicted DNA-binding protein